MARLPKILITNDDGISAEGIRHLYWALQDIAEVFVVAPSHEQSGAGLGVSVHDPLHIKEVSWEGTNAWTVTGTPTDCVKMAVSVILDTTPDLIVSGINRGTNSGRTVLYSGTIGGVIEGVLRDIPGIAFSAYDMKDTEYASFTKYVPAVVQYIQEHVLPKGTFLNVNFPSIHTIDKNETAFEPKGIKLTSQGKQYVIENPENIATEDSHKTYKLGFQLSCFEERSCSDIHWLEKGYITAAPIHVEELTDKQYLAIQKEHFEENISSFVTNTSVKDCSC